MSTHLCDGCKACGAYCRFCSPCRCPIPSPILGFTDHTDCQRELSEAEAKIAALVEGHQEDMASLACKFREDTRALREYAADWMLDAALSKKQRDALRKRVEELEKVIADYEEALENADLNDPPVSIAEARTSGRDVLGAKP